MNDALRLAIEATLEDLEQADGSLQGWHAEELRDLRRRLAHRRDRLDNLLRETAADAVQSH
ncbi:hypothetical protein [Salinicola salarius]|uniref:hypothetical protein n=1 Tax=Salinicola salarius TaxID=430457 RepID=UPI000B3FD96D|nr:hypothetical protein [Salinicola salarius]